MKNPKATILKALFSEAKKLGIDQETLRDDIAPAVINKRLSAASSAEVARVLVYIHNRHGVPENPKSEIRNPKLQYESSRRGLLQEVADLAKQRFGDDFVRPLNALCEKFKVEGYRSMRVSQAKAVKATLIRLQREDPRAINPKSETLNTKQETQNEKVITFQKGRKGFFNQLGERDRRHD